MRRLALAVGLGVTGGLIVYAAWLTCRPRPDPSHPARSVRAVPNEPAPSSIPPPPSVPATPPLEDDGEPPSPRPISGPDDEHPRPTLGGSMEPDRLERAERIYEQVMDELAHLDDPSPREAAEIFLRGKAAIERMQDEADDPHRRAEVQRKLEALRAQLERVTQ